MGWWHGIWAVLLGLCFLDVVGLKQHEMLPVFLFLLFWVFACLFDWLFWKVLLWLRVLFEQFLSHKLSAPKRLVFGTLYALETAQDAARFFSCLS